MRRDPADNLPSGSSFLIVTEGSKTEPNYFKALRDRLRLVAADVDIEHPEGTDPIVLTQHAITRRDERRLKPHEALRLNMMKSGSYSISRKHMTNVVGRLNKQSHSARHLASDSHARTLASSIGFSFMSNIRQLPLRNAPR